MIKNNFIPILCPKCKSKVLSENVFRSSNNKIKCDECNITYNGKNGCYDFIFKNVSEKEYYENKYYKDTLTEKKLDFSDLRRIWYDPYFPEAKCFLEEIKKHEIKDKTILLLGNGESIKELYFLKLGARIIYSDLSINSVLNLKNEYDLNDYKKDITFHAIDAFNIPLNNNSIDMVYGYAFIHHIHDLDCFFNEIHRILKPNGICLFLDNAYSPIMQFLKWKLLLNVTKFIQKNYSTSPEDEKASLKGGVS